MPTLQPAAIMYGPRYAGSRLPGRTRPNASARCTAPRSATRVGQPEALVVTRHQLAPDQSQSESALRPRRERPAHRGSPVGTGQAVGVGAGEQLGARRDRGAHAGVGRGAGALLRLVDHAPSAPARARPRTPRPYGDRGIRRAVVDEDDVEVRVALGGERLEGRTDAAGLVEHRDDDGKAPDACFARPQPRSSQAHRHESEADAPRQPDQQHARPRPDHARAPERAAAAAAASPTPDCRGRRW